MEKLSYNYNLNYIVLDLETENLSLSHYKNRPWQVGILECCGSKTIKSYSKYIRWDDLNLSIGAARKTRFDNDVYIKYAEDPLIVWNEIKDYFKTHYIVTQNGLGFDTYLIKSWLKNIDSWGGFGGWIDRSIDINLLSRAYFYGVKPDMENFLSWQYKMITDVRRGVKTNLRAMCKEFDIEFDDSKYHEAFYDVEKTKEVFQKLIYKLNV